MRPKPLSGVRVLDLTRLLPGPMATLHLADLGADVIKIEDTGAGDYGRTLGPMDGDTSHLFALVNRNKRGLRLDLKQAAGVELFLRLARDTDVVLESFRPGVVDKLGVGYAAVSAINPRVVYCSITGYGQNGPYRERAGHDINFLGYAGVLDQIGVANGTPALPNFQIGDLLGGALSALVAVLAALLDARGTGKGRYIDVAMADGVLAHAVIPMLAVLVHGRAAPRGDDLLSGGVPCYGVYATADGRHLAVGALEPKFWARLCEITGRTDLVPHGLATGAEGARVRAELQAVFFRHSLAHWTEVFDQADCCVTPILRLEESLANEQFRARHMVVNEAATRQLAPPFKMSDFEFDTSHPAPAAGEHSDAILREAGYSAEQIAALRARQII